MYWHCEDNDHIDTSYLSEEFVWWDVSVLWGQYLHHRQRALRIAQHKIPCYRSLRRLWLSLWGRHCFETTLIIARGRTTRLWLHCGLAITVVERLQRYNCIWLTYIDNVEQNILFYIEVEAVRYYPYVESWFGNGTLCSDYVLYSEEGCTDTLCESLRSCEADGQR